MTDTTAPRQRTPMLAPDGRLRRTQAPTPHRLRPGIETNQGRQCERRGCAGGRFKLSRFCKSHARTYSRTGHPTALTVRRGSWAPYVLLSIKFVNDQLCADHPGIEAAVRWCAQELFPKGAVISKSDPRRPHRGYQAALTRCRRHGVEPVDLVARAIAAELADDRSEAARPIYASDQHRIHQGARLFLAPVPHRLPGYARRRREGALAFATETKGPSLKVREYTHYRVNAALGLLALKAAEEIRRRLARDTPPPTGPVSGSSSPFTNT
jgi:hypothetical protein